MTRREGAHVVVADIQGRQAEETAWRVAAETGRRTLAAPIDVTDEIQVSRMVDRAVRECAKHAARVMQAQRGGVILQINSKSGGSIRSPTSSRHDTEAGVERSPGWGHATGAGGRDRAAPIRLGGVAALDALGVSAEEAPGRLPDSWRPAAPLPEHSRALLAHIGTACDRMHAWRAGGCPVLDVE